MQLSFDLSICMWLVCASVWSYYQWPAASSSCTWSSFFGFILIKQNLQEKISRFPHESRFVSCDVLTPHLALHLSCSGVVSKPAIYELALYILHMEWLFCLYPSSCLGMDFHQQTVAKEIPLVHKWPAIQLKARCRSVSSLNVHLTDEVVVLYPPPIHTCVFFNVCIIHKVTFRR